jgi:hypothetical protein
MLVAVRLLLLFSCALLLPTLVEANSVIERPLNERLAEAEVIVVAIAVSTARVGGVSSVATLSVESTLKGRPNATVSLYFGGVAEMDPNCCVVGRRYLLLLKKQRDGAYVSVNGPFGVYALDPKLDEAKPAAASGPPPNNRLEPQRHE